MTDAERAVLLEFLAREGREQAPDVLPEADGPPPFPPEEERMVDFTEELAKALRQVYAEDGLDEEAEDPPDEDGPEETAADLAEELLELLRQTRQEAAALGRYVRELEEELERERSRQADEDTRREGRQARIYGLLAGVGISVCLLPLLTGAASLGWRLFQWLAGTLGVTPQLLAGGIALVLSGAVLLHEVKPLGQRLLKWMEDDEWEED